MLAGLLVTVCAPGLRVRAEEKVSTALRGPICCDVSPLLRYRYPIEPVLAVLGGLTVMVPAQLSGQLRARLFRAPASDAPQLRAGPGG
jgi:hypothetical protein